MPSSNLAVRMECTAPDTLSEPPRPLLRVVTHDASVALNSRPRTSFQFRRIVIRDQGLRTFRIR